MLKSWRLGSLFGFPVEINASFLFLLAVVFLAFGGLTGVVIVTLAFGSVLLHELGHALVARQLHVRVSGIEDVMVRFGKCCSPLPGERITGFITRGRGVTVHALDCPKVLESDPQRRIDVQWEDGKGTPRPVKVEVTCGE